MMKIHNHFFLGLSWACFLTVCLAITTTNVNTDQSALLALKAHITEEPHQILAKNWSIGYPVCDWFGVTCGSRHFRVTALNVSSMNLTGTIPPQLGNLSFLVSLDMSQNKLTGELPSELGRLRRLRVLNLGVNELNGEVPPLIGSLHELKLLSLRNNSFTGFIPPSISNMSKLVRLGLSFNSLQGNIPGGIFNISSLEVINLNGNGLSGSLPDYICQHLQRLNWLSISLNGLTGQMPSSIGQCIGLQTLSLSFNKLSGVIPKGIENLKALDRLYLGANMLEGAIPTGIGNLTVLRELDLSYNNITGEIPKEIFNSTMLTYLTITENNITGGIPREISKLYQIDEINLGWNKLTGLIPMEVFNLSTVRRIELSNNQLSGSLPPTMGHGLPNLQELFLQTNNFGGAIPESISNSSELYLIELSINNFIGPITNSLGDLRLLQILNLNENNLTSDPSSPEMSFITSLTNCQYLTVLGLSSNPLNGILPHSFGNLSTSLKTSYLYNCKIQGSIPSGIGNLSSLITLSLSDNQLTGSLPNTIKDLQMLQRLDLSRNKISISLQLFCDYQNLGDLYLEGVHILGTIPECFGNVTSLSQEFEDGNADRFVCESLLRSLEALQQLTAFDVSFNKLSGEIPSGGPFTNFTAESFISNEALCGAQRFHVPPCRIVSGHTSRKKKMLRIVFVLLGVIIVLGAMSFGFVYLRCRRKGNPSNAQEDFSLVTSERISYYKLLQATDGYNQSNLLGTGSFGSVYKGTLDDGRDVAIKVFSLHLEGSFKSFDVECEVLCNLRHRNLTKVISSCSNLDFKALVLEYMPNGSLEKWLYSHNHFLNIMQRLDILIDVACAIQYLHCENPTPVVHCDLKPSNVLLDQTMVAHVCDFGISKLLGHEDSITYTKTLATLCYLAPEYGLDGLVSTKCDIYSFGIMMMEVFTGKSPNDEMFGENLSLKSWVNDSLPNGLAHVTDANLLMATEEKYFLEILSCISSIMEVALNCTKESPRERSDIKDVHATLNKIKHQLLPLIGTVKERRT